MSALVSALVRRSRAIDALWPPGISASLIGESTVLLAIDAFSVAAISSALMKVPCPETVEWAEAACCSPAAKPSMSASSVSMEAIILLEDRRTAHGQTRRLTTEDRRPRRARQAESDTRARRGQVRTGAERRRHPAPRLRALPRARRPAR